MYWWVYCKSAQMNLWPQFPYFFTDLGAVQSSTTELIRTPPSCYRYVKSKGIPRQAEVALGVPGRLRLRIITSFGTTRVVGRQPNASAAFTSGEMPGTHFQRLSWHQGTWFCRKEPRKKSQVTPPAIDPGTIRLVAQRLNHYATPGPATGMSLRKLVLWNP